MIRFGRFLLTTSNNGIPDFGRFSDPAYFEELEKINSLEKSASYINGPPVYELHRWHLWILLQNRFWEVWEPLKQALRAPRLEAEKLKIVFKNHP